VKAKAVIFLSMVLISTFAALNVGGFQGTDLSRVEFENEGITLVGQVLLPQGEGPFPAVVMVHGSGRATRRSGSGLATQLVAAGIAVLSYDKRGVGESAGTYSNVGPQNSRAILRALATDALAGLAFLQTLDQIDPDEVGLFGNSQAGWIIPLAASLSDQVDFAAILVGPTVSVGEEIFYSDLTGNNVANTTEERLDEISEQLAAFNGNKGFSPRESIETMTTPGLWVLGGRDESIPTRETIVILEEVIDEFDKEITIHLFPSGTHGLRDANSGQSLPFMSQVTIPWILDQVTD